MTQKKSTPRTRGRDARRPAGGERLREDRGQGRDPGSERKARSRGHEARDVARRVLRRVQKERAYVTLALDAELGASAMTERDRRLATEITYGVCRHQSRLDRALAAAAPRGLAKVNHAMLAILRVAAYQILFLDRVPDHAAVNDAVGAARRLGGPRLAGFANGVLRRLAGAGEPALPPREPVLEHIEVVCSMPSWIVRRLSRELGAGADLLACAQAFNQPPPLAIRVQGARAAALAERLRADHLDCEVESSPVCPGALVVIGLGDPEASPSFAEGLWTVQDIGAQLIGHFVGDVAGVAGGPVHILDACAGLGGKALHLAERFAVQGEAGIDSGVQIHAADISASKLDRLQRAAERLGVAAVRTFPVDLTRPAGELTAAGLYDEYDAVLLDAPCTGLGVLRRHPEAKWRVTEPEIAALAAVQAELLDVAAARVRPGGVLVYSVCTFTGEEGPAQLRAFLSRHPEFALCAPNEPNEPGLGAPPWDSLCSEPGVLRTWPHRDGADAFFAARLRRAL